MIIFRIHILHLQILIKLCKKMLLAVPNFFLNIQININLIVKRVAYLLLYDQQLREYFSRLMLINPLTPRCAESFIENSIYRKMMKKDRKIHILPFLGLLFRMAQSEFSKKDAKPFIFPKIPQKTLFLRYDIFSN